MSDIAIKVDGLSKRYCIGAQRERYQTLRDTIASLAKAPLRRLRALRSPLRPSPSLAHIWALKDVSFEVRKGEVVGIIGRNGAGKTTLLKVLARITEPTEGYAEIRGRVGSLLEVGTGFHPELTGRENVFLSGAVLGMRRTEIQRKFQEIVSFAEMEPFMDTPLKRYSSGMYVRLAFAVAAHLQPEILLIDEVLAVGDAAFQRKCLGKMGDVAKQGRTILFVSHNMGAIANLCHRAVLLDSGRVRAQGEIRNVVDEYVSSVQTAGLLVPLSNRSDREGSGALRFVRLTVNTRTRAATDAVCSGEDVELVVEYASSNGQPLRNVSVSIPFYDYLGQHMFMCWTRVVGLDYQQIPPRGRFVAKIPQFPLPEGNYNINLWCEVNGILADWVKEASTITVVGGDFFQTGKTTPQKHGGVLVKHTWQLEEV